MTAARMSEQMDRAGFERRDEARHIRNVLLHGEIVALSVPMFGPAMPEAQGDRPVMPAERRHLPRPLLELPPGALPRSFIACCRRLPPLSSSSTPSVTMNSTSCGFLPPSLGALPLVGGLF